MINNYSILFSILKAAKLCFFRREKLQWLSDCLRGRPHFFPLQFCPQNNQPCLQRGKIQNMDTSSGNLEILKRNAIQSLILLNSMELIEQYETKIGSGPGAETQTKAEKSSSGKQKSLQIERQEIEVCRTLKSHPQYEVLFKHKVEEEQKVMVTTAFIYKGSELLRFRQPILQLLMKRINCAQNKKRACWLAVHPLTGLLSCRQTVFVCESISLSKTFFPETSRAIDSICGFLDQELGDILRLAQMQPQQASASPKLIRQTQRLDLIRRSVALSQEPFPLEFPTNPNPERKNPRAEISHNHCQPALEAICPLLRECEKYFPKLQRTQDGTSNRPSLYTKISLLRTSDIDWRHLATTHFSKIQTAKVSYYDVEDPNKQEINAILVRKTDLGNKKKLEAEKRLLSNFKFYSSPYFVRTLYDDSESIYSEYSTLSSLEKYMAIHEKTIVLDTKLFLLSQILEGLRLLRLKSIVHVDLKPQNLLVHRGLLIKLTDLGQSYHPSIERYNPGYTLPYSAPEIFDVAKNKENLNSKVDVYNFGVMMLECLFGSHPFTFRKSEEDQQIRTLKSKSYYSLIRSCPTVSSANGPVELMSMLQCLAFKCLHPETTERPSLDWLIVILRESYYYIQNMYF